MAIRTSSRISRSVSVSTTSNDSTTATTDKEEVSVAVGPGNTSSGSDGLSATIGGNATAVGNDTLASTSITAEASSQSGTQQISASADFYAAAQGETGSGGTAYTTSFIDLAGDADHVVTVQHTSERSKSTNETTTWESSSSQSLYAVDLGSDDDDDTAQSQPVSGTGTATPAETDNKVPSWEVDEWDGNLVFFDIDVVAIGDDTYAGLDLSALAVDEQLSVVDALVTVGVG
ncbi:hypothetical protein [Teichococcus oryzae]|uniref:Uncharacterized protein n=1 Tax=Teichococcus oryzae TaxID=1608942 RepID=A0A5B2TCR2_9PROT|nr:hypothetical protein [Pseudoroseomonas oryzae]KAA2211949.1 hypothetical protein F0Q34_17435 [Pseudoroseomonas oryzae]